MENSGFKILKASCLQTPVFKTFLSDKTNTNINLAFGFKVKSLDVERLKEAVNKIVERHDHLRSNFFIKDGALYEKIYKTRKIEVLPFTNKELSDFLKPFDLESEPLIRVSYKDNIVLVDFSHIIMDGFSFKNFFYELNEFYSGRRVLYTPPLAEHSNFTDEEFLEHTSYWEEYVKFYNLENECFTVTELPMDFTPLKKYGGEGAIDFGYIESKITEKIRKRCRKLNVTPFVFYMAAWFAFLFKACKKECVITGTNFSCRKRKNFRSIGLYTTTVPLRMDMSEDDFEDEKLTDGFLLKVASVIKQGLMHQSLDLEALLKKHSFSDARELFNTLFVFEDERMTDIRLCGEKCEYVPIASQNSAMDLTFCFFPFKTEGRILAIYRKDKFSSGRIKSFLEEYSLVCAKGV